MSHERTRVTACPGVIDTYDRNATPPTRAVKLLENSTPAQVTLKEDQYGVIDVACPFYDGKVCTRWKEIPSLDAMSAVCRFAPAASYESYEVYEPPFEPPHFYQQVWDQLSPAGKTALVQSVGYMTEGMEKSVFKGMCYAFQLSDGEELIDELSEMGAIHETSKMGAYQEMLQQFDEGKIEDMEVIHGSVPDREKELREEIEAEIAHYYATLEAHKDDPRWEGALQRLREEWEAPATHIRFNRGLQSFVNQFYSQYGFPINFTKPRDPETYIDEEGNVCLKLR